MNNRTPKSTLDTLFILSLFFVLTITSVFTVVFGAKIYEKAQNTMEENYELRTADLYLRNKIHTYDYEGGVVLDGNIIILNSEGNYKTKTYLYVKDGYLQEMTASEGFVFNYQSGTSIVPVQVFDVEKTDDNMLHISIESNNTKSDLYVAVMSKIN